MIRISSNTIPSILKLHPHHFHKKGKSEANTTDNHQIKGYLKQHISESGINNIYTHTNTNRTFKPLLKPSSHNQMHPLKSQSSYRLGCFLPSYLYHQYRTLATMKPEVPYKPQIFTSSSIFATIFTHRFSSNHLFRQSEEIQLEISRHIGATLAYLGVCPERNEISSSTDRMIVYMHMHA